MGVNTRGTQRLLDDGLPGVDLRWSPEARRFAENRWRASGWAERWRAEFQRLAEGGVAAAQAALADTRRLGVLDDHQWVNVAAMTLPNIPGLCVFDEQGAGKTVTGIFAFDVLVHRDEADFLLIVAPKSMVGESPNNFVRFRGDLCRTATLTGSRRDHRRLLASEPDVLVANFEAVVAMEAELRALLQPTATGAYWWWTSFSTSRTGTLAVLSCCAAPGVVRSRLRAVRGPGAELHSQPSRAVQPGRLRSDLRRFDDPTRS